MATSAVEYGKYGFWVNDWYLKVWLALLIKEIDSFQTSPEWIAGIRQDWMQNVKISGSGIMSPNLNLIVLEKRQKIIVRLCERVLNWLENQGETFFCDDFNSIDDSFRYGGEYDTKPIIAVGWYFRSLISGDIRPDLSRTHVPGMDISDAKEMKIYKSGRWVKPKFGHRQWHINYSDQEK